MLRTKLSEKIRRLGSYIMPFCCIHTVANIAIPWETIHVHYAGQPLLGILIEITVYAITGIGGCMLLDNIKRRRIMKKRQQVIGGN